MMDPVALAYSGRVEEARAAALVACGSDEPALVAQALEAFAVLGQQQGWVADEACRKVVTHFAASSGPVGRNAWEAATALGIRSVEPLACAALASGRASWGVLRFAGEWPSEALGAALERGWPLLDDGRDEALLALSAQPLANRATQLRRNALVVAAAADRSPALRQAAALALPVLVPPETQALLLSLSEDVDEGVAQAARDGLKRHAALAFTWARWRAPAA